MKTSKIKIIALLTGILFSATAMAQNNTIGEYVNKMVEDPEVETATFAISVYNISKGQQIYDYNANKSMIPASIVKIVTTSVGFDKLGKNFRFKTSLGYSGEVDKRGVLQGNVYIVGGGDPILGSYRYKQTAIDSVFAAWKNALVEAGITKINKRICYDASIFDEQALHDSWMWGDVGNYYGCGVHGLNIHENMYFAHFDAGTQINRKATLTTTTPANVDVRNHVDVSTGPEKSGDGVVIYGDPSSNIRICKGTVPLGKTNFKVRGAMPAPPKSCAEMFAKYLNNNNISVSNYVSEGLVRTQNITYLFDYYSPVYSDIATYTNQTSNNIYAESIFKYLGYTKYKTGSFETGAYVISDFLKEHSINTKGVRIVDGSGLSRQNMMTTRFMCNFLAEISKQPYYKDFVKTLPQIGKSGTAKNMLKNQPVKQEIYIKTGSMNGIKTYAGYIINKKGELISFCFMANNFECSQNTISKKLEQILLMIIEQ